MADQPQPGRVIDAADWLREMRIDPDEEPDLSPELHAWFDSFVGMIDPGFEVDAGQCVDAAIEDECACIWMDEEEWGSDESEPSGEAQDE